MSEVSPQSRGINYPNEWRWRATGDAMSQLINAGDEIVVASNISTDDGDLVLARLGDRFVVRKLCVDDCGQVWLVPENERYEWFNAFYTEWYEDFSICGKVIGIVPKESR